MGFFDRIGDIGKGFADVGLGIGKFGVDTVMSGKDILTGDVYCCRGIADNMGICTCGVGIAT